MDEQIVIMVDANAGGVGKSTIVRELGHLFSMRGMKTLIVDLDPSPSQHLLNGLNETNDGESVVRVLRKGFKGNWPNYQVQGSPGLELCMGSNELEEEMGVLHGRDRKAYILRDVLEDRPTDHKVIILDCPGSRTLMNRIALAAATHVLLVVEPETKSANGLIRMVAWLGNVSSELRLRPAPKIVGVLPSKVNRSGALQRGYMEELESLERTGKLGIPLFREIPDSKLVANSVEAGRPMRAFRPGWSYNGRFEAVVDAIIDEGK